ncbi:MAG: TolB family protein, partial [Acidimicrobiia bacterium]
VTDGDEPTWSPDGSSLAIVRDNAEEISEIYVVDLSGSDPVLVTEGDDPTWSPDGTTIAFSAEGDEGSFVYTVVPGSDPVELVEGEAPAWSPEGDQITFTRISD